MKGTVLLMVSTALTLLLAGGVALAINEIRCSGDESKGTRHADEVLGADSQDIAWGLKGEDGVWSRSGTLLFTGESVSRQPSA